MATVTVKQGKLKGIVSKSDLTGKEYYSFIGIPFAKPPLGDLRFRPPQRLEKWEGVFEATKPGSSCIQTDIFGKISGSEDCLNLNVYTPSSPSEIKQLKPVVVFNHGGGFYTDSSSPELYSASFLINYDVIFASYNYRLHALGFVDLGTEECPGNCGLKDQLLALQWINENIASFGGDPNNITLVGESAGAASVHLHMLSPRSKGLFQKAVLQSGHCFNEWSLQRKPRENALRLAKQLEYQGEDDVNKIATFLKAQPVENIAKAVRNFQTEHINDFPGQFGNLLFVPTIETLKKDAFLPESPTILSKTATPIPLIAGLNNAEGRLGIAMWRKTIIKALNEDFAKVIQSNTKCDPSKAAEIAQKAKKFYFGDEPIDMSAVDKIVDLITDFFFGIKFYDAFDYITSSSKSVHVYEFKAYSELNFLTNLLQHDFPSFTSGAAHADDLPYLFRRLDLFPQIEYTEYVKMVIDNFCTLITNFAKYGNPSEKMATIDWKPYTHERPHYLQLDKDLKVIPEKYIGKRVEFWKECLQ